MRPGARTPGDVSGSSLLTLLSSSDGPVLPCSLGLGGGGAGGLHARWAVTAALWSSAGSPCVPTPAPTPTAASASAPWDRASAGQALSGDRTPCSLEELRFLDRSVRLGVPERGPPGPRWLPARRVAQNLAGRAWSLGRWGRGCPGEGFLGWYPGGSPSTDLGDDDGRRRRRTRAGL